MQFITDAKPNHVVPQPALVADSYQQGSIKMTLENADLWKAFHSIGTEMVITKHGRRMFPHCNVSLSGLQPHVNYVVMVDMVPSDSLRYKWNKEQWEVAGKAEPQLPCRTYMYPDSPAMGRHWMKRSLSFLKMKLTNNILDQHGHIILHSMHRYYPRFHVIQADSPYTVRWGPFQTFSFPETSFTSVTAYQNPKITKLKIDHNPFAKGFRDGGTHSHSKRCRPNNPAKTATMGKRARCKSPPVLQRMPCPSQSEEARKTEGTAEEPLKKGHLSPWEVEQDPSEGLHTEAPEPHGQDYRSEEQMVPASMAYQPYRSVPDHDRLQSPSNEGEDGDGRRNHDFHVLDVATVPCHEQANRFGLARDMGHHQQQVVTQNQMALPCQEYLLPPVTVPISSKANPVILGYSIYGQGCQPEQNIGQWGEVDAGGQYMVHTLAHPTPHLLATAEHSTQQRGYQQRGNHHHGNTADWSQYPLFSYSCW